ncbi:MAG: PaaI family thioesterase [Alphaproteobacteria bacterium]|jgi:uncharacterized protein (TIGR00369 family)|nr:PaaI family thioesterase [Alphaproteobacteria bacterium]MDP6621441.1 PaaI family thioesterase [Alphaproteobacteria bacterium]
MSEVPDIPAGFEPRPAGGEFTNMIGPIYQCIDERGFCYAFRAEERHTNNGGVVHGGMLVSVMDVMLAYMIEHEIGPKPRATTSLSVDFLTSARPGDWLEARGTITRRTSSLVFVRGLMTAGERPVLGASGMWALFKRRD